MLHVELKDAKEAVRLGNSLTWEYSVESDGIHFYHKGDDVTSALKNNGVNNPNLVLKPGDKIYFDAGGMASKYGIETGPKDPFRRVFWEEGLPSKRELFHVVSGEEVEKYYQDLYNRHWDDIEKVQKKVPGSCWYNYGWTENEREGKVVFCAGVWRDWYHQWWHLEGVYCVREEYTVDNAKMVIDKLLSRN